MAKYLLLKHYRGGPDRTDYGSIPMQDWTPEEISAHIAFMDHVADTLRERGEYVEGQALSPDGTFVRYDGEGKPPVTDGPFAETKDLIAGWMVIDVDSVERAHEAAAFLSSAPGRGGEPIQEWIEVRPFLEAPSNVDRVNDLPQDLLRDLGPRVLGVLVRRGADFAAAEDAVQEALLEAVRRWPDVAAGRPDRLAGHRLLAQVPRRRPLRRRPAAPARSGCTTSRPRGRPSSADDTLLLLFLCCHPALTAGVRGGADAAGRRRPDHPADRRGLPGAGADDGAADQPRQADRRRATARPARRPPRRAQGPLPDLQRGLLRRGRPRGRGDPADPPAALVVDRARGRRAARADAAPPRAARRPVGRRRLAGAADRAGPVALGHRAGRRGGRDAAGRAGAGPAGRVPGAGRDRRAPLRRRHPPTRPTGPRSSSGTTSCCA